jgi:hypothetical protein
MRTPETSARKRSDLFRSGTHLTDPDDSEKILAQAEVSHLDRGIELQSYKGPNGIPFDGRGNFPRRPEAAMNRS